MVPVSRMHYWNVPRYPLKMLNSLSALEFTLFIIPAALHHIDLVTNGIPIYVGKAVPPGAHKGNFGLDTDPGQALYRRLKEHAESIRRASNLNIKDFQCRYLVVDDIWIPLGEALLIAKFAPIWNKIIDGFGNHDPGKGRYQQLRSRWDTLHPGRSWAHKCQERGETSEQIEGELIAYLESI